MANEFEEKMGLEDPIWPFVVTQRLQPYIPYVRRWWSEYADLAPLDTGVYGVDFDDPEQPPGLFYRFTRSAAKSPIKGIQAFPFIIAGYLQISGVKGGSTKVVQRVCMDGALTIDEFTCVEIHNLPSTFNQGQLIAFVPTELYQGCALLGKWIYLTNDEISHLLAWRIPESAMLKFIRRG